MGENMFSLWGECISPSAWSSLHPEDAECLSVCRGKGRGLQEWNVLETHHRWLSPTSYSLEISSFALLHSTDCTLNSYLQFGAVSSSDFWLPRRFLLGPDARSLLRALILCFCDGTKVSPSYCRLLQKSSAFNIAFMTDLFIHWVMNGKENCFSLFYWVIKGKIALLYLTAQPLLKIAPDYIFSGSLYYYFTILNAIFFPFGFFSIFVPRSFKHQVLWVINVLRHQIK